MPTSDPVLVHRGFAGVAPESVVANYPGLPSAVGECDRRFDDSESDCQFDDEGDRRFDEADRDPSLE